MHIVMRSCAPLRGRFDRAQSTGITKRESPSRAFLTGPRPANDAASASRKSALMSLQILHFSSLRLPRDGIARQRGAHAVLQIWSNQLRLIWKGQPCLASQRGKDGAAMGRRSIWSAPPTPRARNWPFSRSCLRARGAEVDARRCRHRPADDSRRRHRRRGGGASPRRRAGGARHARPGAGRRGDGRWPSPGSSRRAPVWPASSASAAAAAPRSSRRACASCPTGCPRSSSRPSPRATRPPTSAFRTSS